MPVGSFNAEEFCSTPLTVMAKRQIHVRTTKKPWHRVNGPGLYVVALAAFPSLQTLIDSLWRSLPMQDKSTSPPEKSSPAEEQTVRQFLEAERAKISATNKSGTHHWSTDWSFVGHRPKAMGPKLS